MAKRKRKLKLPKRIAGVKIPKAARKGPVADFINSSGGQVLLAEALVLAAGLFGVRRLEAADGTRSDVRGTIEEASARLTYACSEALKAFRVALAESVPTSTEAARDLPMEGQEESLPDIDQERPTLKKKRRSSKSEMEATKH